MFILEVHVQFKPRFQTIMSLKVSTVLFAAVCVCCDDKDYIYAIGLGLCVFDCSLEGDSSRVLYRAANNWLSSSALMEEFQTVQLE